MLQRSKKVCIAAVGAALLGAATMSLPDEGKGFAAEFPGAPDAWLSKLFGDDQPDRALLGTSRANGHPAGTASAERNLYAMNGQEQGHGHGQEWRSEHGGRQGRSAQPSQRTLRPGPAPSAGEALFGGTHVQSKPLEPHMVPPQGVYQGHRVKIGEEQAAIDEFNRKQWPEKSRGQRQGASKETPAGAAAHEGCNFVGAVGADLLERVRHADGTCHSAQYALSLSDAQSVFTSANMVTLANEVERLARIYDGDNDGFLMDMIYILRAGYFLQDKYRDQGFPAFNANVAPAVRSALDAYFNNNVVLALENDVHARILNEALTLIDSSQEALRYLPRIRTLIQNYDNSYEQKPGMQNAIRQSLLVLFNRGKKYEGLSDQMGIDIATTLASFIRNNFGLLDTNGWDMVSDSGAELGRFLQYSANIKAAVSTELRDLVPRTSFQNSSAPLRAKFAAQINAHDRANCQQYGLCDYIEAYKEAVLPTRHVCTPNVSIRAQRMTADQLRTACNTVAGVEGLFHQRLATGNNAVANDNTSLEMVIFDSSSEYRKHSSTFYGNGTNNGGIYLEGNPATAGNQGRFIAYRAEWIPAFTIWNLEHEFVHYLDGRYNLYGDFNAAYSQGTVWWTEGLAEYISWSFLNQDNTRARDHARSKTWTLSQLFKTDYGDSARVYQGGYLAVRYMFEERSSDVNWFLSYFRPGNYAAYKQRIDAIGTGYDGGFNNWLACYADGTGCRPLPECTAADVRLMAGNCSRSNISQTKGNHAHFYMRVPAGVSTVRITASGGTGNASLFANTLGPSRWAYSYDHNYWSRNSAGNEESIVINNPPTDRDMYFSLYGETDFSGVRLTVSY